MFQHMSSKIISERELERRTIALYLRKIKDAFEQSGTVEIGWLGAVINDIRDGSYFSDLEEYVHAPED